MELISNGGIAEIGEPENGAVVTRLRDLFDGDYLAEEGLSVCFPFADRAQSRRFLTEDASARTLVQRKDSLHVSFSSNASTKGRFSPSFQLLVLYTLDGAGLRVECTLNNIAADMPLPFYLGLDAHLRQPLFDGDQAGEYTWQMADSSAQLDNRRTGRGIAFSWEGFSFALSGNGAPLVFDAKAENGSAACVPPMQAWHAVLHIAFL